jgi:hypothetical protein
MASYPPKEAVPALVNLKHRVADFNNNKSGIESKTESFIKMRGVIYDQQTAL